MIRSGSKKINSLKSFFPIASREPDGIYKPKKMEEKTTEKKKCGGNCSSLTRANSARERVKRQREWFMRPPVRSKQIHAEST